MASPRRRLSVLDSTPFILAVVCFDHHMGPEVEFVYPPEEHHDDTAEWQDVKSILPFLALPTRHEVAAEKTTSTCFFFHLPPSNDPDGWKGVAYYDVIDPHGMHLDDATMAKYSRGAIQKSVVVLSKTPYQAYVQVKLQAMAQQFFAQSSFGDFSLLTDLHAALTSMDVASLSQLHVGLPLLSLVHTLDMHMIALLRLLWIEGRIVFYSESPQVVSSHLLAFLSLLPGGYASSSSVVSDVSRYRWGKFGLPLQLVHRSHTFSIEPYLVSTFAVELFRHVDRGFVVGSCDPMCLKIYDTLDAVVDLDAAQVYFHSDRAKAATALGPATIDYFDNICAQTPALEDHTLSIEWVGSDMWIRQQVQLYMENFLTDIATDKPRSSFSFWSSPSHVVAEYDATWLGHWYGTFNYNQWLKGHHTLKTSAQEKSVPPPDAGRAKYTYPNGDVYDGDFDQKQRHGRGKYVVANTGYSYEGEWQRDLRHGQGVLKSMQGMYSGAWVANERCGLGDCTSTTLGSSYRGQWRANVYHGSGRLVQNGLEYEGEFQGGRFEGMGKCTYSKHPDWTRYRGEWKQGLFDGLGTLEMVNSDVYVGEFVAGKRQGQGTLTSSSGDVYTGQWKANYRDGHGRAFSSQSKETKDGLWKRNEMVETKSTEWVIVYANMDKYVGTCQSGRPWGQGICRYANGSVYTGAWVDGLREGLGIFCDHSGRTFEGEWRNSQPWQEKSITPYVDISLGDDDVELVATVPSDGQHVFEYENGDTYTGTFRKGKRHGRGKYVSKLTRHVYDGEWDMDQRHGKGILTSGTSDFIYDGDWVRDTRTGKGTCIIRDAETYTGDWVENRFHGTGIYTDADGHVYDGEFDRGLKHGMGKLTTPSHQVYQGEFFRGEKGGIGICTYPNGDVYTGEWRTNHRHGEGTLLLASGERYVGQWHDNVRQGCGIYTDAKGTTKEGLWSADAPMNGEWHIKFSTGSSYNGECLNGKPHGQGVCKYTNGDVYSGTWEHGVRSGWGVCVFANGDVFEGEWTSNHVSLHGKGTLTLANGTVHAYAQ
ncbi:Aste57867_10724 [Aphanomyces stellatus]|uniref:Aste57867_10724 protein n=1 Tax=Aphanomyces stellatus TaxID=120398 RepID=A0A485KR33_9STRA|nr:hypothetical protein As57867_010684 [Aphanomyces stellatus]VFT87594.1 Aste57867_10724 [Aphanomyces stellatus]